MKPSHYIIFIIILFASCNNADEVSLQRENQQLKAQLEELKNVNDSLVMVDKYSQVALADTQLKELRSTYNDQLYKIKIKLPRGYEEGAETYPVLYVTDAETNFGGVSYIVQRLMKDKLIPPIIVVGIAYGTDYDNFYKLRSRDLTFEEIPNMIIGGHQWPTGGAEKFTQFIEKELFPFIDKNYRTQPNDRAYYGHSYGGLFGCTTLLHHPELFNKYLILSPSLWYADSLLLDEVRNVKLQLQPTQVYMGAGELEWRIDDLQMTFANTLKNKHLANLRLEAEVKDNETHRTIFGTGFTNGLRFIYKKK